MMKNENGVSFPQCLLGILRAVTCTLFLRDGGAKSERQKAKQCATEIVSAVMRGRLSRSVVNPAALLRKYASWLSLGLKELLEV